MLTHIDVCSGIGAFGIAAHFSGFQTAAFCEIEEYPRRVIARHFPKAYIHDDIKTLTGDTLRRRGIERVYLFSGGIPCQPFSVAGKRGGTEDDRHLWPEAYRLICDMRPDWVCIENVGGFVSVALDLVLSELADADYTAGAVVLPACAVNAPHRRDRVWIVGHANPQRQPQPEGAFCEKWGRNSNASSAGVALGDACFSGLPGQSWRGTGAQPENRYSQLEKEQSGDALPFSPCNLALVAEPAREGGAGLTDNGEAVVNTGSAGRKECDIPAVAGTAGYPAGRFDAGGNGGPTQSCMGRGVDGLTSWVDRLRWPSPLGASSYEWEPARTATNIKNRTVRLKACGNAIVWPVAAVIFSAIREAI